MQDIAAAPVSPTVATRGGSLMTTGRRKWRRRDGCERELGAEGGNLGEEKVVVCGYGGSRAGKNGGADMVRCWKRGRLVTGCGRSGGCDAAVVVHAAEVILKVSEGLPVWLAKTPVAAGFGEEAGLENDVVA